MNKGRKGKHGMVENIDIVINTDSIERSENGGITGEIFFEVSNGCFPEEHWNDFIVVILGWWANNLKKYYEWRESDFELCFMDGSFL